MKLHPSTNVPTCSTVGLWTRSADDRPRRWNRSCWRWRNRERRTSTGCWRGTQQRKEAKRRKARTDKGGEEWWGRCLWKSKTKKCRLWIETHKRRISDSCKNGSSNYSCHKWPIYFFVRFKNWFFVLFKGYFDDMACQRKACQTISKLFSVVIFQTTIFNYKTSKWIFHNKTF